MINTAPDFLMEAAIRINAALLTGDKLISPQALKWTAAIAWDSARALLDTMPEFVKRDIGESE